MLIPQVVARVSIILVKLVKWQNGCRCPCIQVRNRKEKWSSLKWKLAFFFGSFKWFAYGEDVIEPKTKERCTDRDNNWMSLFDYGWVLNTTFNTITLWKLRHQRKRRNTFQDISGGGVGGTYQEVRIVLYWVYVI